MEGNYSSAGLMLLEYHHMKKYLKTQLKSGSNREFQFMLVKMIERINTYLDKALSCNAVLLATILNPAFQLSIFDY